MLRSVRLRIMTYNILLGGLGPGKRDRTDELLSVIAAEDPDVLALQECAGFLPEERGLLRTYERRLGMTGLAVRARSTLHLALLARPALDPRLEATIGEPFRHAALRASIAASAGTARLHLIATHLNPFVEDARLAEVELMLKLLPAGEPALVLGDFNALSSQDDWSRDRVHALLAQYVTSPPSKSLSECAPDGVQTRAMDRLRAAGLVDLACTLGERANTYPTLGAPAPEGPPIRIDYMLATPGLVPRVRALKVVRTPATDVASDHFPVVCELELADPA